MHAQNPGSTLRRFPAFLQPRGLLGKEAPAKADQEADLAEGFCERAGGGRVRS